MLGTIVNVCTILIGSTIGSVVRKGIKEEYSGALFTAMGLPMRMVHTLTIVPNMMTDSFVFYRL